MISRVIDFARSLLENTKGGLIAGIGVLLLFWSAVKVLNHIEATLNHIWKVHARSTIRKFTDFLSIMIISPLLVVVSSSVNVYITAEITAMAGKLALLQAASPVIFFFSKTVAFRVDLAAVHPDLSGAAQHAGENLFSGFSRYHRRFGLSNPSGHLYQRPGTGIQIQCDLRQLCRPAALSDLVAIELDGCAAGC